MEYAKKLLLIYGIIWTALAINPVYPSSWLLENYLVFISVPFIIWTYKKFRLSSISYTCIFIFMVLHAVGAHYTYAEVPLGFWLQEMFSLSRNHFDRIVHFSFGLLTAYPIREVFMRVASAKGVWGYYLPIELTLAFSAIYEIVEWGAAAVVDPHAGAAFLGSQGDIWDAQKDMLLAGLGATLSMMVAFFVNKKYKGDFFKDLKESIKDKGGPLGEVAIRRMRSKEK